MRARFVSALLALLLVHGPFAQSQQQAASQQQPTAPADPGPATTAPAPASTPAQAAIPDDQAAPGVAKKFLLQDGTPVKLRINQTVSSADAQVGQTVDFEVLEEVKVNDVLVIPKGGIAWATVTEAQPKRRLGRGGKLNMNIDAVRLVDGDKTALRAVKDVKGGGHVGAMTGAIVATAIVFWPAAPLFLFMHGKDITVPKGTEITAYINGDSPLDRAKFEPLAPAPAAVAAAAESNTTNLEITSTPDAAEIELDGNFVGSTPSTIPVAAGDHVVTVREPGYEVWERKIRTSGGSVKISAQLQQKAAPEQPK